MPFAWLMLLAAAEPQPVSPVVLASRLGVPPARAAAIVTALSRSLRDAGLNAPDDDALSARLKLLGMRDTAVCGGKRPCLIELGKQLNVVRLIAVSVAEVKPDLSVSVEAIEIATGKSLASASGVLDADSRRLEVDLSPLGSVLMSKLVAAAPAAPEPGPARAPEAAAPPVAQAAPAAVEPAPAVSARSRSTLAPWLIGAGAVLAAAGAAGFFADAVTLGNNLRGVPDSHMVFLSALSEEQARGAADRANADMTVAICLAAVTVVCTVVALWLGLAGGE